MSGGFNSTGPPEQGAGHGVVSCRVVTCRVRQRARAQRDNATDVLAQQSLRDIPVPDGCLDKRLLLRSPTSVCQLNQGHRYPDGQTV